MSLGRSRSALVAALSAMLLGFILLTSYVRRFQREATGGRPIELLALRRDVSAGATLSEDALIVRTLPEGYLEDRQVLASELPKVLGVRAAIDLRSSQTLLWTDLATAERERALLSGRIPKGMRAMTLGGVGRREIAHLARPGDRTDVLLTRVKPGSDGRFVTIPLLQNLLILAVGDDVTGRELGSARARADSVTLLVTLDQAGLLAHARREGALSLALRNGDDLEINETLPETDDSDVLELERRARRQGRLPIERID